MDGDKIPRFEFATATRIIFGAGTLHEAGTLAKEMGSRALGFSIAHPDASPGYATTLGRLEERLATFGPAATE